MVPGSFPMPKVPRRQYPWVFDIELIKVEEDPPYFLIALLVLPIIAGELYIRITGKTPGDALNEYLYGDFLNGV